MTRQRAKPFSLSISCFQTMKSSKSSHFKTPTLEYYEVVTDVLFLATERKGKHPNFTNIIYFR